MTEMSLEDWREQDKARKIAAGIDITPPQSTLWSEHGHWFVAAAFVAICVYFSL